MSSPFESVGAACQRPFELGTYPEISLEFATSRLQFARNLLAQATDPSALKATLGKHAFVLKMQEWEIARGGLESYHDVAKTEEEHRYFMAEVRRLAGQDPDPSTEEGARLELLAKLLEDYEKVKFPFAKPDRHL